jgi:hypothetical protein
MSGVPSELELAARRVVDTWNEFTGEEVGAQLALNALAPHVYGLEDAIGAVEADRHNASPRVKQEGP